LFYKIVMPLISFLPLSHCQPDRGGAHFLYPLGEFGADLRPA
jgi:hypothetical protein